MSPDELRALQAPFKAEYRADPASAVKTLRAEGTLDPAAIVCRVATPRGIAAAGLHPAAGGNEEAACSGEMLLEALVACAGVTLGAVATAMAIPLRGGTITAEGELDFRGTLGLSKEVPIGFRSIRLGFHLETDATAEQVATLIKLTERYCVIYQTLAHPPEMAVTVGT